MSRAESRLVTLFAHGGGKPLLSLVVTEEQVESRANALADEGYTRVVPVPVGAPVCMLCGGATVVPIGGNWPDVTLVDCVCTARGEMACWDDDGVAAE